MKNATKVGLALILAAVLGAGGWTAWKRVSGAGQAKVFAAGTVAPDFELPDQDGKPLRLSSLRGQKVLVVFYKGYY